MANKPKMNKEILAFQNNPNFVILNNPLANPKFVRAISKTEKKALSAKETYTPKLFFEVASRLQLTDLDKIRDENGFIDDEKSIRVEINIREFAKAIGATKNNSFIVDLKNTATFLSSIQIPFIDAKGELTFVGVVNNKAKFTENGNMTLFVDGEMADIILNVRENGNFSFLKEIYYGLDSGQSLKLYPFFKSWTNKGRYETGLERFKEDFGFNTSGYTRFAMFEARVLKPAIEEINEKTDIIVTYETTGENLDGLRPRVTGLIFWITAKEKTKTLPTGQVHTATPKAIIEPTPEPIEATPPQEQPKPAPAQAVATANPNDPTTAEIATLISKIDSKITPEQIELLIELYNPIRVWEMAKQAGIEHKKTPIKNLIGFIKNSSDMLGLGLWKKEQNKKEQEETKVKQANEKEQGQVIVQRIIDSYDKRANDEFKKKYQSMTEQERNEIIDKLKQQKWTEKLFKDGRLTQDGIVYIGQVALFGNDYDRRQKIINYALKFHNVQLKHDYNQKTDFSFA